MPHTPPSARRRLSLPGLLLLLSATALAPRPAGAQAAPPPPVVTNSLRQLPACDRDGKYTGPAPAEARRLCADVLAGGVPAVRALADLLDRPPTPERDQARYLLHGLVTQVTAPDQAAASPPVTDALAAALGHATGTVARAWLIEELQALGDPAALPALADCLRDPALADPAARALVTLAGAPAAAALHRALRTASGRAQLTVIQALGDLRVREAAGDLRERLARDPSLDVRAAAGAALARLGDARAAKPLLAALRQADGSSRRTLTEICFVLARNLGAAGEQQDARRLYADVWDTLGTNAPPQVRDAVVAGLAEGLATEPTAALVKSLRRADPAERAATLSVLGQRADTNTFDAVAAALRDDDPGVRRAAVPALARVGGARSVPLLTALLPGRTPAETQAVRDALLALPAAPGNQALIAALTNVRETADATTLRLELLDLLAKRKAAGAADPALVLAAHANSALRLGALRTLGSVAPGSYAAPLIGLLPRLGPAAEWTAAEEALVEICRRRGAAAEQVAPLAAALTNTPATVQAALLRTAGRLGSREAADLLQRALASPEAAVRDEALRNLAEFPNDTPAEQLLEIARTGTDERHQVLALRGFVRMAEKVGDEPARLRRLTDALAAAKRPDEQRLALAALGKLSLPEALPLARQQLANPELVNEAGSAILELAERVKGRAPAAAREALQQVADSAASEDSRRRAREALPR